MQAHKCKELTPEQVEHNEIIEAAEAAEKSEREKEKEAEKAIRAREQEEEAARNKAILEKKKAWGLESGSELLRLRIEEDTHYTELCDEEWAEATLVNAGFEVYELPAGRSASDAKDDDTPGVSTLLLKRDIREKLTAAGLSEGVHFALMSVYEFIPRPGEPYDSVSDLVKRHDHDVVNFYIGTARGNAMWDLSWVYAEKPIGSR